MVHLAEVRKQGFASEECESNADVACVAAPVWDAQGKNVAAISISVPMGRVSPGRMLKMREIVITGAARMSAQLGASGSGVLA
jgi:IclR family KDG regulon transcriptional repressor